MKSTTQRYSKARHCGALLDIGLLEEVVAIRNVPSLRRRKSERQELNRTFCGCRTTLRAVPLGKLVNCVTIAALWVRRTETIVNRASHSLSAIESRLPRCLASRLRGRASNSNGRFHLMPQTAGE